MASTRQCLLNQFADLSVCANQNNLHKNSILVSDLRIYLFTFNLGGESPRELQELPRIWGVGIGDDKADVEIVCSVGESPDESLL
jgi:hypothetical protein